MMNEISEVRSAVWGKNRAQVRYQDSARCYPGVSIDHLDP